ncbi:CPBP family intramembrane glutamic endopeptidase [Pradoshia sp.]
MNWKEKDKWGWTEFAWLTILEAVVVIGVIKFFIKPLFIQWFGDELYAGTLMGLIMAIVLLSGIYLIALRPKNLSWREVGIVPFAKKDWRLIILLSIALLAGAMIVMALTTLIGNSYENSKTEAIQNNIAIHTVLIAFVSAAIISPIYEEIFYRGFLYRWLRTRLGMMGALILSSLIFTLVHIPTYNVMPVNFLSGIIFAWAYERTGSIWPPVLIHGLTNGIMVLLTAAG